MKNIHILYFTFCVCNSAFSQTIPNWAWAKSYGNTNYEYATSIAQDSSGNVYVAGWFDSPTINFDLITLTNNGSSSDIYLTKFDNNGNVIWAKSFGTNDVDRTYSIVADRYDNIYLTGEFKGDTITFDSIYLVNHNIGKKDIFFAKFDNNGNIIMAKCIGGNLDENIFASSIDINDNFYFAGSFESDTIFFDSAYVSNPFTSSSNMFIAKYSNSGNVLWVKSSGGGDRDGSYSIAIDHLGYVYLSGYFYSQMILFGTDTLINASNSGYDDLYLVKYDSSGNVLWARSAGSTYWDVGFSISIDKFNNIYMTGYFQSPTITFGLTTLYNAGYGDVYVVKYNSSGVPVWATSAGANQYDVGQSIITDTSGNIFLAGIFQGDSITFGTSTLYNNNNGGTTDIFLVKCDSTGFVLWAVGVGGNDDDNPQVLLRSSDGSIYCTGGFNSSSVSFGSTLLTNSGITFYNDIFLAKLDATTGVLSLQPSTFNLHFFPNPLTTQSKLTFKNPNKEKFLFTLYDITGRVTETLNATSDEIIITKGSKQAGVYLFNLVNEKSHIMINGKVVIGD